MKYVEIKGGNHDRDDAEFIVYFEFENSATEEHVRTYAERLCRVCSGHDVTRPEKSWYVIRYITKEDYLKGIGEDEPAETTSYKDLDYCSEDDEDDWEDEIYND